MKKIISMLNNDLSEAIINTWRRIPSLYKQSFAIIFISLNVVFLYHTVHFIWGNHEWSRISSKLPINMDFWNSRFSAQLLKQVLTGGYILPVWTNIMSFIGLSLAAILLCYYWKLPKNLFLYSVAGLLLVLQPQICEWLYYSSALPDLFWGTFYIILALILLEKTMNINLAKKTLFIIISIFLFLFAINLYPSIINAIAVIFLGRMLVDLVEEESWGKRKYYITTVVCILTSGVGYALIVASFKKIGIVSTSSYTIDSLPLKEIPARFIQVVVDSLHKLIEYNQYFFPKAYIILFFILLLVTTVVVVTHLSFRKGNTKNKIFKILFSLFLILGIIIFANSTSIVAKDYNQAFYSPRIDFFSIPYMFILFFVVTYKSSLIFLKNIVLVLCISILGICIIQNILFQKVLIQGLEAEKMFWQRMTVRIEEHPNFNPHNKYTVFLIGNLPSLRTKYYPGQKNARYNGALLNFSFDAFWRPMRTIMYYYPTNFIKNVYTIGYSLNFGNDDTTTIIFKHYDEIMNAEIWPAKTSVIITDDTMIIVIDNTAHEIVKGYLRDNTNL